MTNLHLYDGPMQNAFAILQQEAREAAAERMQDRLDREFQYTSMSEATYDEGCETIKRFALGHLGEAEIDLAQYLAMGLQ